MLCYCKGNKSFLTAVTLNIMRQRASKHKTARSRQGKRFHVWSFQSCWITWLLENCCRHTKKSCWHSRSEILPKHWSSKWTLAASFLSLECCRHTSDPHVRAKIRLNIGASLSTIWQMKQCTLQSTNLHYLNHYDRAQLHNSKLLQARFPVLCL